MEIDLSGGNSINTPYKINKSDNSFTFTVPIHSTSGTTYFEIEEDQTYNINAYNTIHVTGQYHQPTISAPSADLSRYQIWTRRGYMYAHRALQVDETFNVSGTKYQLSFENLNSFSKFISKLSENNPLLYGSMAILLAIVLGVVGAGGRQLFSKYRHVFLIKKN